MAIQRAQGWLELKLPLEANEELDEVQPQLRAQEYVRVEVPLLKSIREESNPAESSLRAGGPAGC